MTSHEPISWSPVLGPPLQRSALEAVVCLARRFSPPFVKNATHQMQEVYWRDSALATGFPSLALLFLYLARSSGEQNWLDMAIRYASLACEATIQRPLDNSSLTRGTAGLGMMLNSFSLVDQRFVAPRETLNRQLATQVLTQTWVYEGLLNYDLISGATGVLGYLTTTNSRDERVQEALHFLLQLLVPFAQGGPERWSIPGHLLAGNRYRPDAQATVNCGLAHGVAGPLAALSLARLAGYSIEGQQEAIATLAHWLANAALAAPWGFDWTDILVLDAPFPGTASPTRSSWCYGAPGIMRALWLAERTLKERALHTFVMNALDALIARPATTRDIDAVTLCHGTAGLLQICLRFFHETGHPALRPFCTELVKQLLEQFHEEASVGFRYEFLGHQVASLGILLGASGTLLALLAASSDLEPAWDRLLLLA